MKPGYLLTIATVGLVILDGIAAFTVLDVLTSLLTGGQFAGPSVVSCVVLALCAFGIARTLQHLDVDEVVARRWAVAVSVFLFYSIARLEFAQDARLWDFSWLGDLLGGIGAAVSRHPNVFIDVIGLSVLWVRGVVVGEETMTFESIVIPFSSGLFITSFAAALAGPVGARPSLTVMPIFFLAIGLAVLTIANTSRVEGGADGRVRRTWTPVLLAILSVLVGLAMVTALLDFEGLRSLLAPVAWLLLFMLNGVLLILTYAIVYPIYLLLRGLIFLAGLVISSEALDQLARMLDERASQQREAPTLQLPGIFLIVERLIVILLVAATAFLVLHWLLRRFFSRQDRHAGDRESVYERGSLGDDLGALLRAVLGRMRRPGLRAPWPEGEPDSIRRLYRSVLRKAAADGLVRPPAVTPVEFAPPLVEHFGDGIVKEISVTYATARYGQRPPARAALERLRDGWRLIRVRHR